MMKIKSKGFGRILTGLLAVVLFLQFGFFVRFAAAAEQQAAVKTWDAAAEFSDVNNPNGVWTYAFGRAGLEIKEDGTQTGLFIMKEVKGDETFTGRGIGSTRGTRFGNPGIVGWKGTP